MSWSVSCVGSKDGAVAKASASFDRAAANYPNQEEGKTILACKERMLGMVAGLDLKPDTYCPNGYGVSIDASGSESSYSSNCKLTVSRVDLAL